MSTRAWRLTIEKSSGQCLSVCGSEDVLRAELEAWQAHENHASEQWVQLAEQGREYRDVRQFKVRLISGWSNDASRTEVVVAYRFAEVVGMVLAEC